jgi:hypothetical protein
MDPADLSSSGVVAARHAANTLGSPASRTVIDLMPPGTAIVPKKVRAGVREAAAAAERAAATDAAGDGLGTGVIVKTGDSLHAARAVAITSNETLPRRIGLGTFVWQSLCRAQSGVGSAVATITPAARP